MGTGTSGMGKAQRRRDRDAERLAERVRKESREKIRSQAEAAARLEEVYEKIERNYKRETAIVNDRYGDEIQRDEGYTDGIGNLYEVVPDRADGTYSFYQGDIDRGFVAQTPGLSRVEAYERMNAALERGAAKQAETKAQWQKEAAEKINGLGKTKTTTAEFRNPENGHQIVATVQKVTPRDYWGRKISSRGQYTVYVYDRTVPTSDSRLYYNYGIESLREVKEAIRARSGVKKTTSRR